MRIPTDSIAMKHIEDTWPKKLLKMLGVEYISYHACPNDCIIYRGEYAEKYIFPNDFIIYRGEYADKEICPICGHEKYDK